MAITAPSATNEISAISEPVTGGPLSDDVERFVAWWRSGFSRYPFGPARSTDLYRAYVVWCSDQKIPPRAANVFLGAVGKIRGMQNAPRRILRRDKTTQARVVVPPVTRPSHGIERWISDSVLAFELALATPAQAVAPVVSLPADPTAGFHRL
jgi:hypothetical protein